MLEVNSILFLPFHLLHLVKEGLYVSDTENRARNTREKKSTPSQIYFLVEEADNKQIRKARKEDEARKYRGLGHA